MGVCKNIQRFTRSHERIADLFSLLAVVVLFASIWVAIEYQSWIVGWMRANVVLHGSLVMLVVAADMALIFLLLSMGALRFAEADDEAGCFQTFRGRRHGGASLVTAFRNWVDHMEQVGKKHR